MTHSPDHFLSVYLYIRSRHVPDTEAKMTVPKIKDFVDSNAKEFLSVFEVMAHFSDVSDGVLDVGSSSNDTINSTTTPLMTTVATNPACRKNEAFMQALPWVRITFGVLMVLENTLSLWALWHVRRLQRALQRFMSSLSVGELLTGIWCCYGYGAEVITGSEQVTFECRMRFIGMTYLNFASILSIAAMCLDRALALQCPLRYVELVTPPRVRLVLAVVWLLPLAVVLAAYVDVEGSSLDCDFVHIASPRTYVVLTVLRFFFIAVIISSQLFLFRAAHCHITKIFPTLINSHVSTRYLRMNVRAAVTTAVVVIPFLLLYSPVVGVQARLAAIPGDEECMSQVLAATWLFASAHGLFTPVIFCWRFKEIRANLLRLFCRCRQPGPEVNIYNVRSSVSAATGNLL